MSKQSNRMDLYFLIVLMGFFLLFFIISFSLSRIAGTVPKLISGIAILLCLVVLIKEYLIKKGPQEKKDEESTQVQGIPVYKTFLVLLAYIFGLLILGFPLSTFIVLALWPPILGFKSYIKNVVFSAIATGMLYFVFVKLFYIRLPIGILFESIFK